MKNKKPTGAEPGQKLSATATALTGALKNLKQQCTAPEAWHYTDVNDGTFSVHRTATAPDPVCHYITEERDAVLIAAAPTMRTALHNALGSLEACELILKPKTERARLSADIRGAREVLDLIDAAPAPEPRPDDAKAPNGIYSLCEVVADFSAFFVTTENVPADSRETIQLAISWAQEFEQLYAGKQWGQDSSGQEYMDESEKFFAEKYKAWDEAGTKRKND